MVTVQQNAPTDIDSSQTRCANCGHVRCLFHGEDRLPVYNGYLGGLLCWFPVGGVPQNRPL